MHKEPLWTWKNALLLVLVIAGVYAAKVGYGVYHMVSVVMPHSYAAWTTGDLLVEFMDTHDGNWPRSWEDLAKARDTLVKKGRNILWDFDKLPAIVKIDWNANPSSIAKAALAHTNSAIRVVTQLDGTTLEARWGADTEPNGKVLRYFIQRYSPTNSSRSE